MWLLINDITNPGKVNRLEPIVYTVLQLNNRNFPKQRYLLD
jgi:hypothetical protein